MIFNSKIEAKTNNAVIYARYSSSSQTEQSIEGQLRICKQYAEQKGYRVINEYIDRAKTGTNVNRPAFQNMIADSESGQFSYVIVYMVDRFARSKEDSVVYKSILRKNGVRVLSATEQIGETDEGYLIEGLLEMFAEQYSTKLSKRVKNGLIETRAKGNFTGGHHLIGFKTENHKVVIDEERAPIIRFAFEQYANGVSKKEIVNEMNRRGWRSSTGAKFTINSLGNALRNKKYIGEYYFNGEKVEGYPVLIDPDIFYAVQKKLDLHKHAPATEKAKVDYLLYGKAYCGYCGDNMVGVAGTSKTGRRHHYYACATKYKKHTCKKKSHSKDELELLIVENIQTYVTVKESAERVADLVIAEYERHLNNGSLKALEKQIVDIDKELDEIANAMIAAKNVAIIKKLDEKADDLTQYKEVLEEEQAKLQLALRLPHSKDDIIKYLALFADGNPQDIEYRKRIIDRLVNTIYIYDDKVLIYFNILDDTHIEFDNLPDLDEALATYSEADLKADGKVRILSASPRQDKPNKNFPLFILANGHMGFLFWTKK